MSWFPNINAAPAGAPERNVPSNEAQNSSYLTQFFKNQFKGSLPTIKTEIGALLTKTPDPLLEHLYQTLSSLKQQDSSLAPLSNEQKKELYLGLKTLLETHKKILANTFESNGLPTKLSPFEENAITLLIMKLEESRSETQTTSTSTLTEIDEDSADFFSFPPSTATLSEELSSEEDYSSESDGNSPISGPEDLFNLPELINSTYKTIARLRDLQMGLLATGVELCKTKGLPQVKALMGLSDNGSDSTETICTINQTAREIQQRILPTKKIKAKDKTISEQFEQLKTLITQATFTWLTIPNENFLKTFQEILELFQALHNAHPQVSADEVFQEAIMTKFKMENRSFLDQKRFSMRLRFARYLKPYIEYGIRTLEGDLTHFLNKNPDERMELVFAQLIRPLASHLAAFFLCVKEGKNVEDLFNNLKIDRQALSSALVEKYIPSFSFTDRIQKNLDEKFPTTDFMILKTVLPLIKTLLQFCVQILKIPEWGINKIHQLIIQSIITLFIPSTLFRSNQPHLSQTSLHQHTLNQFVLEKLRAFDPQAKKKSKPLKTSRHLQDELTNTISQFCTTIPLQQALEKGPAALNLFLNPGVSLEALKQGLEQLGSEEISPIVSNDILKVLEDILQKDLLERFIWEGLDNLSTTLQNPPKSATHEEMKATAAAMFEELENAATRAVEDIVATALDRSKKLNNETESSIEELKTATIKFAKACTTIDDESFEKLNQDWKTLASMVTSFMNQLKKTQVSSLLDLSSAMGTSFAEASEKFSKLMKKPQKLQKEKKDLTGIQKILEAKQAYFQDEQNQVPDQILAGLNMLQGQMGSKDPNLSKALRVFVHMTENYKKVSKPNTDSKAIFDTNFQKFKKALDQSIQDIKISIGEKSKEITTETENLKNESKSLKTWAKELAFTPVESKEVVSSKVQVFRDFAGQSLQNLLVNQIMKYGTSALKMKSKSYHLNGLAYQMTEAYLNRSMKV